MDICLLTKDKPFLFFLKHQVKGVFDNDCICYHNSSSNQCIECTGEIIKHSKYKEYFNKLYNWFKELNFENSHDIVKYFKSIHNYLTSEQVSYFCSPWLDGVYSVFDTIENKSNTSNTSNTSITSIFDVFESLCLKGKLETLKWLYNYVEESFINNTRQQPLLYKLCIQNSPENTNAYEILSWLFSLKIFNQVDVHAGYELAFRRACEHGNIEVVKFLLNLSDDRRIDVHTKGNINFEIQVGDELAFKNVESDIRIGDELAFRNACYYGHIEVVKLLLNLKGDREINVHAHDNGALKSACIRGHLNIVKLLLNLSNDKKINVHFNDEDAFITACCNGHVDIVEFLLNLPNDRRINVHAGNSYGFILACEHGHLEVVKLLLRLSNDRRVNVHVNNNMAFEGACENGHLEVVKLLLNLDKERKIHASILNNGFKWACYKGRLEVVKLLLSLSEDRRINVNIEDDIAFRYACCEYSNLEVVKLLLSLEGNQKVNVYTGGGEALQRANQNNNLKLIELLQPYFLQSKTKN